MPMSSSTSSRAQDRTAQLNGHMGANSDNANASAFTAEAVPQAPEDAMFGLMAAYRADSDPNKVDLGIGAYRDNNGKPWVLPVVKKADDILRSDPDLNHEYLPIAGLADFTSASQKLILGADSPVISEKRIISFQSISGTGAVHLGGLFLSKFYNPPSTEAKTVYLSSPTWVNHHQIFGNVRLPVKNYPYFHKETRALDFDGLISTLKSAPSGSIVVLHGCAHNPTGVDPTQEQWKQIAQLMKERQQFPFFDNAYQGFASGSLSQDGWPVRLFAEMGFEFIVAQSYAKNFGLYGERTGCLHFITGPGANAAETTKRVGSQIAILQRSEISNPPAYGARIVSLILNDKTLFAQWEEDLAVMSGRIKEMRKALRAKLEELGTPGKWNHITDQIGMFSFTGLTEPQVKIIRSNYHVYMTTNGRASMAGINTRNVEYLAKAIDAVVRAT